MIKILALLLLLPTLAWAGPEMLLMLTNGAGTVSEEEVGGCSSTPFLTQTVEGHDQSFLLGTSTLNVPYYVGILNTGTSDLVICSIDVYVRKNGTLSGETLSVEKWSTTSTLLDEKIGSTITTVDANTISGTLGYLTITFPSPVTISQNQVLAFTLNKTIDGSNNITFAYKGTTSTIADQVFYEWNVAKERNGSSNNDIRAKFYGSN